MLYYFLFTNAKDTGQPIPTGNLPDPTGPSSSGPPPTGTRTTKAPPTLPTGTQTMGPVTAASTHRTQPLFPTLTTQQPQHTQPSHPDKAPKKDDDVPLIVGLSVAGVVLCVVVAAVTFFCYMKR